MLFILAMQQHQNLNDDSSRNMDNDPSKSSLVKEAMQIQSKLLQQKLKDKIRQIQQEYNCDHIEDRLEIGVEENNNNEVFNEINENILLQNFLENQKNKIKKKKALFNLIEEKKVNGDLINKLQENKCSICLDDLCKGKRISYLPCCHIYHSKCIKKWLKVSNFCPLCKEEIKM